MTCIDCHRPADLQGRCATHWCDEQDRLAGVTYRYFVTEGSVEREVDKREWVAAERRAGFTNTLGFHDEPATAGFSTSAHAGIAGRIERIVPQKETAS